LKCRGLKLGKSSKISIMLEMRFGGENEKFKGL